MGYGSTLANARWHTAGARSVVYCGSSRALCQLEKRVHANGANVKNQAMLMLTLPANALLVDVESIGLPADWASRESLTQKLGDDWLDAASALGLWVPSYVEPGERNLLLNPAHPSYSSVLVSVDRHPFEFDLRLFSI